MPVKKLKEFLDRHEIEYVCITHSPAYTALATAASAHVPYKELAKTVMVVVDGELAMAVLPASERLDLDHLKAGIEAQEVRLASETEFERKFLDCDIGAMPPFGSLYGLDVYVSDRLAEDEEIAFNAGSHRELIRMRYADFERLVEHQTLMMTISTPPDGSVVPRPG